MRDPPDEGLRDSVLVSNIQLRCLEGIWQQEERR